MNLFLDASVVLAACGRPTGASRAVFDMATRNGWTLLTSQYVILEITRNIPRFARARQFRLGTIAVDARPGPGRVDDGPACRVRSRERPSSALHLRRLGGSAVDIGSRRLRHGHGDGFLRVGGVGAR